MRSRSMPGFRTEFREIIKRLQRSPARSGSRKRFLWPRSH